jgi:hypothetical protein
LYSGIKTPSPKRPDPKLKFQQLKFQRSDLSDYLLPFRSSANCFKNDRSITSAPLIFIVESERSLAIIFSIALRRDYGKAGRDLAIDAASFLQLFGVVRAVEFAQNLCTASLLRWSR